MTERQACTQDYPRCPRHDSRNVSSRKRADATCTCSRLNQDPLAALERARRLAYDAQEAERWDGLS